MSMKKRPLRIAVVGIDGTGKTTVTNHIARILGKSKKVEIVTLAPRKKVMKTKTGKKIVGFVERINRKADKKNDKSYVAISQILMNRIFPWIRLGKEKKADVVIYERHPKIDYNVYGDYYLGRVIKNIEKIASGTPNPDIIFYLDSDPEIAFKRIVKRQKRDKKYLHPHERSVKLLKQAKVNFEKTMNEMKKKNVKVIRINTNQPLNKVLDEVERELRKEVK